MICAKLQSLQVLCDPHRPDLLQRLDSWRGDRMGRGTAIRVLLEQALDLHRDGTLPAAK